MILAKGIVLHGPQHVTLESFTLQAPDDEQILVEMEYSAVSTGTEMWYFSGKRTQDITYPSVLGYQGIGIVTKVGKSVDRLACGDRVYVRKGILPAHLDGSWMGAHCSHLVCHQEKAVVVPPSLSPKQAVLNAVASITLHGFHFLTNTKDSKIVILGQGIIGLLAAQLAQKCSETIITIEPLEGRRLLSEKIANVTALQPKDGYIDEVKKRFGEDGVDIVIETTGKAELFSDCIHLIKPKGEIIMQGWYGSPIIVDGHEAHNKEASLYFPKSYTQEEQRQCFTWIAEGSLDTCSLISTIAKPDNCQSIYEELFHFPEKHLGVVFEWC